MIQISAHAVMQYRNRIGMEKHRIDKVREEMRRRLMLIDPKKLKKSNKNTALLIHEDCVFVASHNVIVTVLHRAALREFRCETQD